MALGELGAWVGSEVFSSPCSIRNGDAKLYHFGSTFMSLSVVA